MSCSISTTQTAACASGIGKLTNPIQLLQIIAQSACELSAGGGGTAQIKVYTADPNAEAITPSNTAAPAVAYSADGTGAIYVWSIISQTWL